MHECPVDGSPSFGFDRCYWLSRNERCADSACPTTSSSSSMRWNVTHHQAAARPADAFASVVFKDVLSDEDAATLAALARIGIDANADFLG